MSPSKKTPVPKTAPAHSQDVEAILARRHDNGGDFWASEDGKLYVGNPFSTLAALGMLHELDVPASHEAVAGGLALILEACREDGRIKLGPKSPMYPCYTAEAARTLCRFGLARHEATRRAVDHFLDSRHASGGWRCDFKRFGPGPGTECANPGATAYVLDVLRFDAAYRAGDPTVDAAVESLLTHWERREPTGPCRWGIGSLFMQVEFPFLRYNLFYFVYVLSFFDRARGDPRFRAALDALEAKVDGDGGLVVERPHRALKGLSFCTKGEPSEAATRRLREIRKNVAA